MNNGVGDELLEFKYLSRLFHVIAEHIGVQGAKAHGAWLP